MQKWLLVTVCALGAGLGGAYREAAKATAAPEPAAGSYRLRNLAKNLCLRIGARTLHCRVRRLCAGGDDRD